MADDIKIDITADSSGLRGGLTSASSSVNEFGAKTESLNKVGEKVGKTFEHMGERVKETMSAMMGPLMALASFEGIKGIVEDISRLQKLSEKLDMTAESLQRISLPDSAGKSGSMSPANPAAPARKGRYSGSQQ